MDHKHGDTGAVRTFVEHLIGLEIVGIELEPRFVEDTCCAGLKIVSVNRFRPGKVLEGVESLAIPWKSFKAFH